MEKKSILRVLSHFQNEQAFSQMWNVNSNSVRVTKLELHSRSERDWRSGKHRALYVNIVIEDENPFLQID